MSARIGVIGCGWWATRAHLPALQANPDAVIAGIADPDTENRDRAAASASGFRRSVSSPARPRCWRRPSSMRPSSPCRIRPTPALARAVLDRGLHLLLEKPMTIHPPDARALAALAEERGVELIIGYPWHYNRQVLAVRDAIADGPDRGDRIRLLPVRLDRARALSRQSGTLSRHPRLCRQPAGPQDLCRSGDRRRRPGADPGHP